MLKDPKEVLDFWFAEETKPFWFSKSDEFDERLKGLFFDHYQSLAKTDLKPFAEEALTCLAAVITLDQFPRNFYRGSELSFASDAKALKLSQLAHQMKFHVGLSHQQQAFLFMPFMHSEALNIQNESVRIYKELGLTNNVAFAEQHRDIIVRFGRFPHRNEILNRQSTEEELEFLKQPGSSF